MDKISFTGVKNMSYCLDKARDLNDVITKERWLNVELSGRDLHKFRKAFKKSNLAKRWYTNPVQDNFLNINTYSIPSEDAIAINNNLLEVTDETLPMFTELARLTRKIIKKEKSEFICDEKYMNSRAFNTALLMDKEFDDLTSTQFHMPEKVKKGAAEINKVIQRIMEKYFNQ